MKNTKNTNTNATAKAKAAKATTAKVKVEKVEKTEQPAKVEKPKTVKIAKPVAPAMDAEKAKAVVAAVAHPKTARMAKPEAPANDNADTAKTERKGGYQKLDEKVKALRALARRYEFLASALERGAMLKVKTIGEMTSQMRETLDAFEDDSAKGLGAWVHAVPLLKEGATEEQHHAAILKSDKGRHYRRLCRGWLADVEEAKYDGDLIAR